MKHISFLFGLFVMLTMWGCSSDDVQKSSTSPELLRMNVGDRWFYQRVKGNSDPLDFELLHDTLVLEVIAIEHLTETNQVFFITEYITEGSQKEHDYSQNPNNSFTSYWQERNDTLFIMTRGSGGPRSFLFSGYPLSANFDYSLPVRPTISEETNIDGWKSDYIDSKSIYTLEDKNLSLFGVDYGGVNVFVNNSLANNRSGQTTIYNKKHGILQTAIYEWLHLSGYGWMRIPPPE